MSLLRCFKASSDTTKLPDPCGPLSTTVPSSSIESANAEVKWVIETEEFWSTKKRPLWEVFSWFQIGKHAAENGVFYAKKFIMKESSVQTWKNAYTRVFEPPRVHAVRGGVNQVLWAEQFWNGHLQKLDREIFEDCPSAKIGPLENFPLYGITTIPHWYIEDTFCIVPLPLLKQLGPYPSWENLWYLLLWQQEVYHEAASHSWIFQSLPCVHSCCLSSR